LQFAQKEVLDKALAAVELYTNHSIINSEMKELLESDEISTIKETLAKAEGLALDNVIVDELKDRLKILPAKIATAMAKLIAVIHKILKQKTDIVIKDCKYLEQSIFVAESGAFSAFIDEANGAEFDNLRSFKRLRSITNYMTGVLFSRSSTDRNYLTHQTSDLLKSLTIMTFSEHNYWAKQVLYIICN